jgi:transposase InsO family protein
MLDTPLVWRHHLHHRHVRGLACLATVIDLASRRVVGWALVDHMRTELVADALRMGCTASRPPPGVIFHSDRGCQYTSREVR